MHGKSNVKASNMATSLYRDIKLKCDTRESYRSVKPCLLPSALVNMQTCMPRVFLCSGRLPWQSVLRKEPEIEYRVQHSLRHAKDGCRFTEILYCIAVRECVDISGLYMHAKTTYNI